MLVILRIVLVALSFVTPAQVGLDDHPSLGEALPGQTGDPLDCKGDNNPSDCDGGWEP